jgi:ribosomal protein S18 acetylase RimI-like enzyme
MQVRRLESGDRGWLGELVEREWGLPVVSISGPHDPTDYPGFVAVDGASRLGAATFIVMDDACELVTLNAVTPGKGIGSALLSAVKDEADRRGLRLWLITTNENIRAIEFYQRRGMDMVALHRDFVETVRRYKPSVGAGSSTGIKFRHAIEFSY